MIEGLNFPTPPMNIFLLKNNVNDYRENTPLLLLGPLGTVLAAALFAVVDPCRVQSAPHDGVTDTGKVFHPAAAHQNNRVLLKVVAFARNIGDDFYLVGQTNLGYFTEGRVRLLGRGGVNPGANAPSLWACAQSPGFALEFNFLPAFTNQLIDSWHNSFIFLVFPIILLKKTPADGAKNEAFRRHLF